MYYIVFAFPKGKIIQMLPAVTKEPPGGLPTTHEAPKPREVHHPAAQNALVCQEENEPKPVVFPKFHLQMSGLFDFFGGTVSVARHLAISRSLLRSRLMIFKTRSKPGVPGSCSEKTSVSAACCPSGLDVPVFVRRLGWSEKIVHTLRSKPMKGQLEEVLNRSCSARGFTLKSLSQATKHLKVRIVWERSTALKWMAQVSPSKPSGSGFSSMQDKNLQQMENQNELMQIFASDEFLAVGSPKDYYF